MLNRLEPALKMICAVLAALLLIQLVRLVAHSNPLAHLTIPALPALAADTNSPTGASATNSPMVRPTAKAATNALSSSAQVASTGTNALPARGSVAAATNAAQRAAAKTFTNSAPRQQAEDPATNPAPNKATANSETNKAPTSQAAGSGTNVVSGKGPGKQETNSAALPSAGKRGSKSGSSSDAARMAMNSSGRPGGMKPPPDLAPAVLARVDKITDSEILGQVIRPLPMALLGIAGNVAFLRAPSGQTGLVKEGDELSGLKLLRIGVNRVLVEQDGEKKELTIFSGYGSESLLPKQKDHSP
jgi:hypothetical protein